MHIMCVNLQAHAIGESDDSVVEAFGEGVVDCNPCVGGVWMNLQANHIFVIFNFSDIVVVESVGDVINPEIDA